MHGSRGYKRMILALFAAGVATFSQLYSVQGVLPELARDLGISQSQAALAVSSATLGLACSVLVWSLLADRMGRLRTMTIAVVCAVVLGLAVPFSPGFEWLLALRFVEGLALGGIPAVALAYLAEEVSNLHAAVAAGTLHFRHEPRGTGGAPGRRPAERVLELAGGNPGGERHGRDRRGGLHRRRARSPGASPPFPGPARTRFRCGKSCG